MSCNHTFKDRMDLSTKKRSRILISMRIVSTSAWSTKNSAIGCSK